MARTPARVLIEQLQAVSPIVAAWLVGKSARWLSEQKDAPRGADGIVDASAIVAWYVGRELERGQKGRPQRDEDPLMSGSSPELERYRAARASLAELDLAKQQGTLVESSQMRSYLAQKATIDRHYSAMLVRKFGNEAGEILQEWTEDLARIVDETECAS